MFRFLAPASQKTVHDRSVYTLTYPCGSLRFALVVYLSYPKVMYVCEERVAHAWVSDLASEYYGTYT